MTVDVYSGWDEDTSQPVIHIEGLDDCEGRGIGSFPLTEHQARELRMKIGEAL